MSDRPVVSTLWPRRAAGLPPGQRLMPGSFPRFGTRPQDPPPTAGPVELRVDGLGIAEPFVVTGADLDGEPLDARHGAPLRVVSPAQYGYKNLKHLVGLRLRGERAPGRLEHLRGRVALEERHHRVPGRLLRWPYRALVVPTAMRAERSLRSAPARG